MQLDQNVKQFENNYFSTFVFRIRALVAHSMTCFYPTKIR